MDECTASNKKKIFSIVVSFFNDDCGESIVAHYDWILLTEVNAKTVFSGIETCFSRNGIPWDNLILDLSGSVIWGKSSAVESKLGDKAPHLLDIDCNVCHHMHNSVMSFSKPFNKYVETFIDDVHTDMKWSSDIRDALKEIWFDLTYPINYHLKEYYIAGCHCMIVLQLFMNFLMHLWCCLHFGFQRTWKTCMLVFLAI